VGESFEDAAVRLARSGAEKEETNYARVRDCHKFLRQELARESPFC